MHIEQTGDVKRSVVIEGTIDSVDNAPVRKAEGKEVDTYQFKVQVEYDQTAEKTINRSIICHYYIRHKDTNKEGCEKLISSLTRRERIICFGTASAGKVLTSNPSDKRIPLTMNVHSFILPDRLNALLAGLTDCQETVVAMEDDRAFEVNTKKEKKSAARYQRPAAKTTRAKAKKKEKEKPKYAFD